MLVQCPRLLLAGAIAVGDITTIGALEYLDAVIEDKYDGWRAAELVEIALLTPQDNCRSAPIDTSTSVRRQMVSR